ncbi:MAG: glycine--tRNA ligase subunit beta [Campylobacterales bacterium]|nr:glycine--tRNA ligase subunit beta [Campylobacterales bacterium]
MLKPLLIEIAVEELPAIPFLKELPNIEKKWSDILEENNLLSEFQFFYTPRRLVFWHREFKTAQDDITQELWGAPVAIAYKDGAPTNAAIGFAKKCGVAVEQLCTKNKGNQEFLYFEQTVKGKDVKELLGSMVQQFVSKLNFGKTMRWADRSDSFVRPIRGLSIVLGDDLVDGELFAVKSSKDSFAHRMVSYDKFSFDFAGDYFCKLDKYGVVLYPQERKKMILDQMKSLENEHKLSIELDEELLDEVVAITEYPTALLGCFDEEFLILPPEVIINSMKEHQRYFAVFKDGKLTNKFVVVSNACTKDFSKIIAGNEKVLRPRLSDAMFFWQNDIKNGLNNEGLKRVSFVEGLGSMYDKCQREAQIAKQIAMSFDLIEDLPLLEEAVMLSKADLLTDMVYEFTELQGLMGYYYSMIEKKDEKICMALKEQYLPDGEQSELPSSIFSSLVSLANKIDNILSLFSAGMIPTGTRDPFALRRAAAGIFKICIHHKLHLDLNSLIQSVSNNYGKIDLEQLNEFINERVYKLYSGVNPSVIKAVLNSIGSKDIFSLSLKIEALNELANSDAFRQINSTFKRVANIVKDIDVDAPLHIDESLFEDSEETELYGIYTQTISKVYTTYDEELEALFAMRPQLDKFFDNVFVNHEDEKIRTNRKNLIGLIYNSFRKIADMKEITI